MVSSFINVIINKTDKQTKRLYQINLEDNDITTTSLSYEKCKRLLHLAVEWFKSVLGLQNDKIYLGKTHTQKKTQPRKGRKSKGKESHHIYFVVRSIQIPNIKSICIYN